MSSTWRQRVATTAVAVLLVLPAAATADRKADDRPAAAEDAARHGAIRRAAAHLVERVPKLRDVDGSPRAPFTQATTGLVLLLDGDTAPGTKAARTQLTEIRSALVRWLDVVARDSRDPERLPPGPGVADSRCLMQYVWPTAQAALLFAEMDARGVDRDEARRALASCVRILAEARCANGGWGHGRFRTVASGTADDRRGGVPERTPGGYPETLVAATNCAALALGAARAALGKDAVPDVEPTRAYYRTARLRNGSFPYDPSQRSADLGETNPARTAGAIAAMRALAMPIDDAWRLTAAYFADRRADLAEAHGSPCLSLFHAALAARALGDDEESAFRGAFQRRLTSSQREDGSIPCPCGRRAFGVTCDDPRDDGMPEVFAADQRLYATSLGTLTLLLMDGRRLRSLDRIEAPAAVTPPAKRK